MTTTCPRTSDADPALRRALAAVADPWPTATTLPTDGAPEHAVAAAVVARRRLLRDVDARRAART